MVLARDAVRSARFGPARTPSLRVQLSAASSGVAPAHPPLAVHLKRLSQPHAPPSPMRRRFERVCFKLVKSTLVTLRGYLHK